MIKEIWSAIQASGLNRDGEALLAEDRFAEAETIFREAYDMIGEGLSLKRARIASNLGYTLLQQGRPDSEAEPYLKQGAHMSDHGVRENMRYADFLMARGRYDEAKTCLLQVWQNDTNEGLDRHKEVQEKYSLCEKHSPTPKNRDPYADAYKAA